MFYGTNMKYSSIEKAFEFNGTDDYVSVKASGVKGSSFNTSHSFSIWAKMTNTASAAVFITVGTSASGEMIGLRMSNGTTTYFVYHYSGDTATTGTTYGVSQEWRHIAMTWDNSHQTIYIDGVLAVTETASSTFLNIPDNPNINLGMRPDGGGSTEYFKGYQSNPKIYDCTLTAEEVKTLYDMGRTGSVANPQPLHIAAPLYSPGMICQVEQSIKTDTFSTNGASTHPVSPGNDVPGLAVTIQPKFANSKILVSYTVSTGAYGRSYLRIQRKQGGVTTNIEAPVGPEANTQNQGKATSSHNGGGEPDSQTFEYYDAVGGTEPITYQIQAWTYHSTYYVYVNRGHNDGNGSNNGTYWARTLSSITTKEVCQ